MEGVSAEEFVQVVESAEWSGTTVMRDGVYPPVLRSCQADVPALRSLCAEHGVTVESLGRYSAFLSCDGVPVFEVALTELDVREFPLPAAAMGLLLTLRGLLSGEVPPSEPMLTSIRTRGSVWLLSGEFGSGPAVLDPVAEVFLRLFEDANPGVVSSPSFDWPMHVLDQAGLLVPSVLLAGQASTTAS